MFEDVRESILKTLIYGDIFDYPLTKKEIWKFLIATKAKRTLFENAVSEFPPGRWELKQGLLFLLGRAEIVEIRRKRQQVSRKKLELAKKIIQKLSLVSTVLFIGISGGLALENSKEDDDIDLFIITSRGTIWFTRLVLVLTLILMGQYRGQGKKKSQKICLNMFLDENALTLPKERQNLYTAHEVAQVMPIFQRNDTYIKFLDANKWVKKFLPNAMGRIRNQESEIKNQNKNPFIISHFSFLIFEWIAKRIQLFYMKNHITSETISDTLLAFHPFEYKNYVLKEYNKRLRHYEIR